MQLNILIENRIFRPFYLITVIFNDVTMYLLFIYYGTNLRRFIQNIQLHYFLSYSIDIHTIS